MSGRFAESVVEDAALAWLETLGWEIRHDPGYRDVVLEGRLRQSLARLNPGLPVEALEDAFRKLTRLDAPSLLERNRAALFQAVQVFLEESF